MSNKLVINTFNKASRAKTKAEKFKGGKESKAELLEMIEESQCLDSLKEVMKALVKAM